MAAKSYQLKRQALKAYRNQRRERSRDLQPQEPPGRESPPASAPGGGEAPCARILPLGCGLAELPLDDELAGTSSPGASLPAPRRLDGGVPAASHPRPMEIQEAIIQRLGHLGRRLEEVHQAGISRAAEERRETWILVLALSVVLIFCFAAFFMNQIEVRDVHTGLQEEIERRSGETIDSFEHALASLRLENLPRLHASVEKFLREKDQRDSAVFNDLLAEVRRQGDRSGTQINESLRILEDHMQRLQRLSYEIHQLQMAARFQKTPPEGPEAAPRDPAAPVDAAAGAAAAPAAAVEDAARAIPAADSPVSEKSGSPAPPSESPPPFPKIPERDPR